MADRDSHGPLPSFARAGTGLANFAPARARTNPAPPAPRPEKTHLHKRLHANTITGGHQHRHHSAKEKVQSAIDLKPPISFDHLLRRDRKSPANSRRGSGDGQQKAQGQKGGVQEWRSDQQARLESAREARARVKSADVEKAKKDNEKREEELRSSLKAVEELGMRSTRQLDDTYYAILEKASILRSTVASFQQLVEESRRLHGQFDDDTRHLEEETQHNLDSFAGFEEQENSIDELVEKLKASKEQTDKLNHRLEAARTRVETFEREEKEKQATRRKQWHATWGTLVGVVVLLIAVLVLRHHRQVMERMDGFGEAVVKAGDMVHGAGEVVHDALPSKFKARTSPSEDPVLRSMFDGL